MDLIKLNKILCPTDFSKLGAKAVQYSIALSQKFQSKLFLIHVVEPIVTTSIVGHSLEIAAELESELENDAHEKLKELLQKFSLDSAEVSVVRGKGFVEIIRFAKEQEIDLIILGTHGRTGLSHLLIGSTAEKVVRKSPCPVLTVKSTEHDFIHPSKKSPNR